MKTPKDIIRDDIKETEKWIYEVVKSRTDIDCGSAHVNLLSNVYTRDAHDRVRRYFREYDGWNRLIEAGYKVACVRIPHEMFPSNLSHDIYYDDAITLRFDIPKVEPIANNQKTEIPEDVITSMKRMESPWHHW